MLCNAYISGSKMQTMTEDKAAPRWNVVQPSSDPLKAIETAFCSVLSCPYAP